MSYLRKSLILLSLTFLLCSCASKNQDLDEPFVTFNDTADSNPRVVNEVYEKESSLIPKNTIDVADARYRKKKESLAREKSAERESEEFERMNESKDMAGKFVRRNSGISPYNNGLPPAKVSFKIA